MADVRLVRRFHGARIPLFCSRVGLRRPRSIRLVLYDARLDWKFKADFIVMRHSGADIKPVRVNIYGQTDDDGQK